MVSLMIFGYSRIEQIYNLSFHIIIFISFMFVLREKNIDYWFLTIVYNADARAKQL